MTEQQIQADVKAYLEYKGYFVFKVHQQGKYCYKGISDLIAIKDGITIFVEVKTDKGKLRPEQMAFMDSIADKGGKYYVVRSLEDIRKIIG